MRICIDARKIDDFGIGSYIRGLVGALARADSDDEIMLLVPDVSAETVADLPERFSLVEDRSRNYTLREQWSVARKVSKLRPDVFHATHYVLPAWLPSPTVVTVHDVIHLLYPEFLPSRAALLYARSMLARTLARARRVIVVSENTRDDLRAHFPESKATVDVVYNGVDERYFSPLDGTHVDRFLANEGLDRPFVLFVGNPKPHKNLSRLIQAWARLESHGHTLVSVGDREGAAQARLEAAELGISERFRQLGHVDEPTLHALYQAATALACPSLYEGFGLPLAEAMACGTPVLTSKTSSLGEISGGAALEVDPESVDEIADGLARLLSEPALRHDLSARGRERSSSFRWRPAAERTLEIYRAVVQAKTPGPVGD